jgi:hypothetical protein
MFNLYALVALTLFNLIAVLQVASWSSRKLQDALEQGTAILCLAVSLIGLGLAVLMPSLGMGIATVSIAALVNLIALLGPGARKLGDPRIAETASQLRGLARLYLVGSPYTPVAATTAGSASVTARRAAYAALAEGPVETPVRKASRTISRPISAEAIRGIRTVRPSAQGSASGLLPRVTADVTSIRRSLSGTASAPARPRVDTNHLTPRTTYQVPQRPNRLPTNALAFLLSVDTEPDIFADARESMCRLPALGKRVHLLSTNPHHVALAAQSANPLPATFTTPDPAWTTSYGRFPALRPIA